MFCRVTTTIVDMSVNCLARASPVEVFTVVADFPSNLTIPPGHMTVTLREKRYLDVKRPQDESSEEFKRRAECLFAHNKQHGKCLLNAQQLPQEEVDRQHQKFLESVNFTFVDPKAHGTPLPPHWVQNTKDGLVGNGTDFWDPPTPECLEDNLLRHHPRSCCLHHLRHHLLHHLHATYLSSS